jgi:hypothetical protein
MYADILAELTTETDHEKRSDIYTEVNVLDTEEVPLDCFE